MATMNIFKVGVKNVSLEDSSLYCLASWDEEG